MRSCKRYRTDGFVNTSAKRKSRLECESIILSATSTEHWPSSNGSNECARARRSMASNSAASPGGLAVGKISFPLPCY